MEERKRDRERVFFESERPPRLVVPAPFRPDAEGEALDRFENDNPVPPRLAPGTLLLLPPEPEGGDDEHRTSRSLAVSNEHERRFALILPHPSLFPADHEHGQRRQLASAAEDGVDSAVVGENEPTSGFYSKSIVERKRDFARICEGGSLWVGEIRHGHQLVRSSATGRALRRVLVPHDPTLSGRGDPESVEVRFRKCLKTLDATLRSTRLSKALVRSGGYGFVSATTAMEFTQKFDLANEQVDIDQRDMVYAVLYDRGPAGIKINPSASSSSFVDEEKFLRDVSGFGENFRFLFGARLDDKRVDTTVLQDIGNFFGDLFTEGRRWPWFVWYESEDVRGGAGLMGRGPGGTADPTPEPVNFVYEAVPTDELNGDVGQEDSGDGRGPTVEMLESVLTARYDKKSALAARSGTAPAKIKINQNSNTNKSSNGHDKTNCIAGREQSFSPSSRISSLQVRQPAQPQKSGNQGWEDGGKGGGKKSGGKVRVGNHGEKGRKGENERFSQDE